MLVSTDFLRRVWGGALCPYRTSRDKKACGLRLSDNGLCQVHGTKYLFQR